MAVDLALASQFPTYTCLCLLRSQHRRLQDLYHMALHRGNIPKESAAQ